MDEPALRDIERWKDKIEVRLDNRQVFFLFFGSALCACMLFVLGVIVGKRLESRGRALAPEVQDPLAVLDRINALTTTAGGAAPSAVVVDQGLTFPKALIGGGGAKSPHASLPKPTASSSSAKPAAKPAPSPPRPLATTPPKAAATPPKPLPAALPAAAATPAPSPAAAPPAGPDASAKGAATGAKGKFTLQLSSFPDKSEAEALAKRFLGQGAYVIASDIPGKGTWYRVRVGAYASSQEALAAKGSFEKQHNVIAYVASR